MRELISSIKKNWKFSLLIIVISYLVLSPSFKLALTGDDYLTYWRYLLYLGPNSTSGMNLLEFLLTDYGPQDSIFALIYNFAKFNALPYYIISFLLRLFASFTFFPLVFKLTKNKIAAWVGVLLFSVISTGLETTNWVFNMPSYIAIGVMNLFLYKLLDYLDKNKKTDLFLSVVLFIGAILSQPIRMMFMPLLAILLSGYYLVFDKNKVTIKKFALLTIMFITIVVALLKFSSIGNSIGATESSEARSSLGIFATTFSQFQTVTSMLQKGDYSIFLIYISNIGAALIPNTIIPSRIDDIYSNSSLAYLVMFTFAIYLLLLKVLTHARGKGNKVPMFIVMGVVWSILVFLAYDNPIKIPTYGPLSVILGGFTIFIICYLLLYSLNESRKAAFVGILVVLLSFTIPWIRNPETIHLTTDRYLIVTGAGITLLFSGIVAACYKNRAIMFLLIASFVGIHSIASYRYLSHLKDVRDENRTRVIRESLPTVEGIGDTKEPYVFYFEASNPEILYHSLMFGFPVIYSFEKGFNDPWHIAYTEDWSEVVAAYKDGSGLKRFGTIQIKPVKITNIYSYRLEGFDLKDTTQQTRNRLQELDKQITK